MSMMGRYFEDMAEACGVDLCDEEVVDSLAARIEFIWQNPDSAFPAERAVMDKWAAGEAEPQKAQRAGLCWASR